MKSAERLGLKILFAVFPDICYNEQENKICMQEIPNADVYKYKD